MLVKKTHENVEVFDNFDFPRKVVENFSGEKLVKMLGG